MLEYLYFVGVNRNELDPANTDPRTSNVNANAGAGQADVMGQRIGAIELAMETLVRLGINKSSFTEEEFLATARAIDAEDGVVDGQRDLSRMRKICSDCGKPNTANRALCMWCGNSLMDEKPVANDL